MEGMLAAFVQFDNDVRSDRTRAGMRAALELGATFLAPLGYINVPRAMGQSLMPDPERAPIVSQDPSAPVFLGGPILTRKRRPGLLNGISGRVR